MVATTSILGDITREILGTEGSVEVLMPVGADPHSFQPSARQAADMRSADLVVANGLNLEEALGDILDAVVDDGGRVLEVGPLADPLPFPGDDAEHLDPHVWLDPLRGMKIGEVITLELTALYPARADRLAGNLAEYREELTTVEAEIAEMLSSLQNRAIVTNHDSLGYLASSYDLEIVGAILPNGSTLAGPSPRDLADLIRTIDEFRVAAIFAETTSPLRLAKVVADEAALEVAVVELYIGSLGPEGSGAETYVDMLRLNATRIAEALT